MGEKLVDGDGKEMNFGRQRHRNDEVAKVMEVKAGGEWWLNKNKHSAQADQSTFTLNWFEIETLQ